MASQMFLNLCLGCSDRTEFLKFANLLDYNPTTEEFWRSAITNWILADRDDLLQTEDLDPEFLPLLVNSRAKRTIQKVLDHIPLSSIPSLLYQTEMDNYDVLEWTLNQMDSSLFQVACSLIDENYSLHIISDILERFGTQLSVPQLNALNLKLKFVCTHDE